MQIDELQFVADEPPKLSRDDVGTTVWSDEAGEDVAFGATLGGWHWLRIIGAGSYRFPVDPDGHASLRVAVIPEAERPIVLDSFYRTVVPLALQAYGREILHGSAVAIRGRVVALCAPRETGKSTIAFALQRRGAAAVADDSVVVSHDPTDAGGEPLVQPLPFALRLRAASAEHFASPSKAEVLVGSRQAATVSRERLPLAAVVLLERGEGVRGVERPGAGAIDLQRLSAAAAFSALLAQSFAFTMSDGERKRAMMTSFMSLARAVPVYRLAYPTGLEHLDTICATIEELA